MTISSADLPYWGMTFTGMPRPLSMTLTELSSQMVTSMLVQNPAKASSTELSTTS